jgi:hypothetical protein
MSLNVRETAEVETPSFSDAAVSVPCSVMHTNTSISRNLSIRTLPF